MKNKIMTKCIFACTNCSIEDAKRYLNVDGCCAVFDEYLTQDELDYLAHENEEIYDALLAIICNILDYRLI